jgi:hypothetical protein
VGLSPPLLRRLARYDLSLHRPICNADWLKLVTQTEQSAYGTPILHKIVTYYDKENYTGQNYTLFDNRLHYCVNFTRGPLVVKSAKLFANTVCDLYTFVLFVVLHELSSS